MIKTMLLTAQLALSPIVGTNGLQPKRLPNPVYGESVNMSVSYDGSTYKRTFYGDFFARNIKYAEEDIYIGYAEGDNEEGNLKTDIFDWAGQTNIEIVGTDIYLSWARGTNQFSDYYFPDDQNYALSFWIKSADYLIYQEAFFNGGNLEASYWWSWSLDNGVWNQDDRSEGDIYSLEPSYSFYTKKPVEENLPFPTEHYIPFDQPTIANPSLYDNIYNFYYQNLFANEALDELGAEVGNNSLTMRQWLAHTATIVSISLLAVALAVLVIKIFKLIAGSISDIWG